MPNAKDAADLWIVAAGLAVYIGACLAWGRMPSGWRGFIRRSETPRLYWFAIGVATAVLLALVALAVRAGGAYP
jgi:H+/Cl- antiporter ClcA